MKNEKEVRNPLYDLRGKFQWDAFFTLFGIFIIPAVTLIVGTLAHVVKPDMIAGGIFAVGILAGTIVAYFIYGAYAIGATLVVIMGFSVSESALMIISGLVVGMATGVVMMLTTTYTPPFSRYIARLKREKEFGGSI